MNNEIDMLRKNVFDNLQVIEEKDKQLDKYKNVIDKIKELALQRKHCEVLFGGKEKTINDRILELLEEVE